MISALKASDSMTDTQMTLMHEDEWMAMSAMSGVLSRPLHATLYIPHSTSHRLELVYHRVWASIKSQELRSRMKK
jgi:hypothetical protein